MILNFEAADKNDAKACIPYYNQLFPQLWKHKNRKHFGIQQSEY